MTKENNLKTVSNWYLFIPFFGLELSKILYLFGITSGEEAIIYYGEVHQHPKNKFLHMMLLPWAASGFCLGVPALFRLNYDNAALLRNWFYLTYCFHYATIDKIVAFAFCILYFFPLWISHYFYKPTWQIAAKGIISGSVLMLVMETVGHSVYESYNSRPEGVINAILYSHFYICWEWIKLLIK